MKLNRGRGGGGGGTARPARNGAARRWLSWAIALCAVVVIGLTPAASRAQRPDANWRTLHTEHFYIHYTPPLEDQARRAAVNAEHAYSQLASELTPPRGMVDIVISDDVDLSNGSATPYPTNRITIYATPPVGESALRFTNDWNAMVITHELTHIFHLDRSRGVWSLAQHIFGRASVLFPNFYSPSWLTEGLAVYYESRFAGAGRIEGSEHRAIARAAAIDHKFPGLGALSLERPRFPFGEATYAYGSLFVDYLARTHGDSSVGNFVEASSAQLVPILLDRPARQGFGTSFSAAWRAWSDSVASSARQAVAASAVLDDWRELTTDGVYVYDPRWLGDTAIIYSGTPGAQSFGAFRVNLDGSRTRMGRRNSRSPNVVLPGGDLLFTQLDFTDPYTERSDLYVQHPGHRVRLFGIPLWYDDGDETRLTRGARLTTPDARADGEIVAMQIIPAGTRLVRVSRDGSSINPITAGSIDEQWMEPRWSHRGDRIAAVRWNRGGTATVVVLDTLGHVLMEFASGHSVQATPSWLPGDRGLVYTSDRTGTMQGYVAVFDSSARLPSGEHRVTNSATGVFAPQLDADGTTLSAVVLRGDGYRLGVGDCCNPDGESFALHPATDVPIQQPPPIQRESSPSSTYSPWRTLWPRYWLPLISSGIHSAQPRIGASTSGTDVVGRHAYSASVQVPVDNSGATGAFAYQYSGFGLPIVQLFASQGWDLFGYLSSETDPSVRVAEVRRRTLNAEVSTTWLRQRVRTAFSFTTGAGVERRNFTSDPGGALSVADSDDVFAPAVFPRVFASAAWANAQRPPFSISPEDGFSLAATARERLRSGFGAEGPPSLSVVGVARAYKSLDLGGSAHHVLALRAAGGWSDTRTNSYFQVGGTSGSVIELIPGYTVGEGSRTFGVRGFPSGSIAGVRAVGFAGEYRAPLLTPGRGLGILPFFFERVSGSLFAEGASAWCPDFEVGGARQVCTQPQSAVRYTLASVGAEVELTAALLSWDVPYRFRVGVAHPIAGRDVVAGVKNYSAYFALGFSF